MSGSDQETLNLLAKGAGITAIALFASKILTYVFKLIVARFLGPDAYGQYMLALMVMGVATTISLLSLNSGVQKFIPEYRQAQSLADIKGIVLSSIFISSVLAIVVGLVMFFGAEFIAVEIFDNRNLIPLLQIMSIGPLFSNISRIFFDTTKAYNIIIYDAVILKIFQSIVKIAVTVVLLFLGYEVIGAAWGEILSTVIVSLIGLYVVEKKIGPIITSDEKALYQHRKLVKYSSPLLLSGLIGTIMGWADTAFLGYFMSDTEVGIYNVALPTAMLIMIPHQAIGSLALTAFSELKERNKDAVEDSLKTATYWTFSLVFPTFLILALFSRQALHLLWGAQYTGAALAMSILAIGYLISASVGRVGSYLQAEGQTNYILYNNLAALALNLTLNIILIPTYGIIGAAIATAASTILTNILMFLEVWKKENVISVPIKKLLAVSVIGLTPLLLIIGLDNILFVDTPFWFILPAGLFYYLIYIVLFLKTMGLGEEEKAVILGTGEKLGYKEEVEKILSKIS